MNHLSTESLDTRARHSAAFHAATSLTQPVIKYAVAQSFTEIAIGSLVHAFHVPLGGHLLSLNQSLLLTWATQHARTRHEAVSISTRISSSAATLKALSPAGKKLTPMLAISVQGWMFSLGIGLLGPNRAGVALGAALSSVWGFAQPVLVAYLLFGGSFFAGIEKLWLELARVLAIPGEAGIRLILGIVAFKALIGAVLASVAWKDGVISEDRYLRRLRQWSRSSMPRPRAAASSLTPIRGAMRDLAQPSLLITTALSLGLFLATRSPTWVELGMYFLRIVALALVFFWGMRAVPRAWVDGSLARFPSLKRVVDQLGASRI